MVAHREVGLGEVALCHALEDEPAHGVGGVLRLTVHELLATHGDVLVERASRRELRVAPGADLVDGVGLEPEVAHELVGLGLRDATRRQVCLVEGPEILVHAAIGKAVAVGLNLQHEVREPHGLHGLAQGAGRLIGHAVERLGHLRELVGTAKVAGGSRLLCLLAGQHRKAAREGPHGLHHDKDGTVEVALLDVAIVREVKLIKLGLGAAGVGCEPLAQEAPVIHGTVGIARGDVALALDDAQVIEELGVGREGGKAAV